MLLVVFWCSLGLLFGLSWAAFWPLFGLLGCLLGSPGLLLEPSWAILESSWACSGASWKNLGFQQAFLGDQQLPVSWPFQSELQAGMLRKIRNLCILMVLVRY